MSLSVFYKSDRARNISVFLFHIALLCGFSLYAFWHNSGLLFIGNDGPMMISLADEQLRFHGASTALHTNFLQGLGNISFPINVSAVPAFWFNLYGKAGPSALAIACAYTWFAVLLFLTVLIVGINYRFPRNIRYGAAWLLTLLFFPYVPGLGIYAITGSAPAFVIYPFAAAVADFGIWRIGRGSWRHSALYAGVVLAGILIILITSPAALILILPFLCVSACISLLSASHTEQIRMLVFAALLLLIAGTAGWIEYMLGLLLNTSSGFYIKELMDAYPQNRVYVSILFQGRVPGMTVGPWLFVLGLLGAVTVFFSARRRYFATNASLNISSMVILVAQVLLLLVGEWFVSRWGGWKGPWTVFYKIWLFAATALVVINVFRSGMRRDIAAHAPLLSGATVLLTGQVLLLIVGEWLMHREGGWTGPALVYYEMPLFALYALFAVFLIMQCTEALPATYLAAVRRLMPALQYDVPVIITAVIAVWLSTIPVKSRDPHNYGLSPASTNLTTILEREIAIRPGAPFAGRVVGFLPGKGFRSQLYYFSELNAYSGNDHQTTGLWLKDIPTLHEYSPLITPEFYSIVHRFLSAPNDPQYRSWTNFSQLDLKILRLLGVRFILSTAPHIENTKERAVLPVSAAGALSRDLFVVGGANSLHLFELKDANVAGVSARKAVAVATAREAADRMAAPAFDLRTAIVMNPGHEDKLPDKLVPARDNHISIENGAYRVRAKSDGWSMLILPIEYSRCMDIKALSGALPQAVRVDIALTGLVFYRELDAAMVQQIGPFTHPRCRFKDYFDFKALAR